MLGLAFSGGKDSLACWYLYKEKNPIVFWVNTGKAYPETIEIIEKVKNEAVEFIEIKTNQAKQIEIYGLPSEIVPIDNTLEGMVFTGEKPVKIQSYLNCCFENRSKPLLQAIEQRGITKLIRGQRLDDNRKSTIRNGSIVNGVTYIQPIETWTKEQVLAFLRTQGELPEHFRIEHSSLDCYDCTAYLDSSKDRVAFTKEKHPKLYEEYKINMAMLKSAILPTIELLKDCDA
jgi:3'-phosphoadenosine 5'-phosphosulfate sulfotransferase (PAPS reductase)/FAD synthetase